MVGDEKPQPKVPIGCYHDAQLVSRGQAALNQIIYESDHQSPPKTLLSSKLNKK